MKDLRIVSFLPSATELLYQLRAGDQIVGVTHECKFPEDARLKPQVITATFNPESMSSKEIDQKTCQLMKEGKDIFALNEDLLKKGSPDFIISQNTCEVCAAHTNQLNQAVKILEKKPKVVSLDPHNVSQILDSINILANLIGKEKEGKDLQRSLQNRINFLKKKNHITRPKVLAIEWLDPFFTAGHWVPELVELAGGINEISKEGEHSRRLDFEQIENANPEIIILMPCGFDTSRTVSEYNQILKNDKRWQKLKAVRAGNVYAVDANSYFSKPSIRTITGAEILAKIIHPNSFETLITPSESFQSIK